MKDHWPQERHHDKALGNLHIRIVDWSVELHNLAPISHKAAACKHVYMASEKQQGTNMAGLPSIHGKVWIFLTLVPQVEQSASENNETKKKHSAQLTTVQLHLWGVCEGFDQFLLDRQRCTIWCDGGCEWLEG